MSSRSHAHPPPGGHSGCAGRPGRRARRSKASGGSTRGPLADRPAMARKFASVRIDAVAAPGRYPLASTIPPAHHRIKACAGKVMPSRSWGVFDTFHQTMPARLSTPA